MTRVGRLGAGLVSLLVPLVVAGGAARAQPLPAPPAAPPAPSKAWVLVDADTGAVLDAGNARAPILVASLAKVLTAVVVNENLLPGSSVTVSARAEGMPASKMNLKQGQVWSSDDLLRALLLVSANDAAVALAERTAGSLEAFAAMMDRTSARIGLADKPVLRDPAGLDDEFSVDGGNLISARDLAIVTRLFLTYPSLAGIVTQPEYRFHGGDGHPHRLVNHNRFLKRYPGAIGVKTGYTRRAGRSLVAAARRDGRTLVAVVLSGADPYGVAAHLLDKGFAAPSAPALDRLPPVLTGDARDPVTKAAPPPRPVTTPRDGGGVSPHAVAGVLGAVLLLVVGLAVPAVFVREASRDRAR